MLKKHFVHAGMDYTTLEKNVPAPYFRRNFQVTKEVKSSKIWICGLGFYEIYINGTNITKGHLAPYRSNHDHYIYMDEYDVDEYLKIGKNVVAVLLGNGMQNPFGGYIWEFDKAPWRSSPQVSFKVQLEYEDGETEEFLSDEQVKTKASPIIFDDLHYGEYYDARLETEGWNTIEFDDSDWELAKPVVSPRGELRVPEAEPLVVQREIKPVSIIEYEDGYIYDFGINTAGICSLKVRDSKEGQKITLRHFEWLSEGKPVFDTVRFHYGMHIERYQADIYYCAGREEETYTPTFTYHGFRYVYVSGITSKQATDSLLTYLEIHSDLKQAGRFTCSDDMANKIQEAVVRSDCSNFHYFPTDCPHREKNGWTADIALSAEQILLNLKAENSLQEWLYNAFRALNENGQPPSIIPTTGWGYDKDQGNGPAWDCALAYIPYYVYKYNGDTAILEKSAVPLMRYLTFLYTKLKEDDLVECGLGDWCQAGTIGNQFETPLVVTDTILSIDIAQKAEFVYDVLNMKEQKLYAKMLGERMRKAFRKHLIDKETLVVKGDTQTAQAMALYYGLFEEEEKQSAFAHLLKQIEKADNHIGTGVLGGRVIFRVLSDYGHGDLAYHMIVRPDFPSYGNWIVRGSTTLWEHFLPEGAQQLSKNHHFWGDVSAWFYYYPGGLRFNPTGKDIHHINIEPHFVNALNYVEVKYLSPDGELLIAWERVKQQIRLSVTVPKETYGTIRLQKGYCFANGSTVTELSTGMYDIFVKTWKGEGV